MACIFGVDHEGEWRLEWLWETESTSPDSLSTWAWASFSTVLTPEERKALSR